MIVKWRLGHTSHSQADNKLSYELNYTSSDLM